MTEDQRQDYIARFIRTTEKWSGLFFEHFPTEEARQRHLDEVKEGIEQHNCPF